LLVWKTANRRKTGKRQDSFMAIRKFNGRLLPSFNFDIWRLPVLKSVSMVLLLIVPLWPQSSPADSAKRGNDYLSKGDLPHAIEAYTESIRLDPESATTFYGRGYAYFRSHNDDAAIHDFTEAIRLEAGYGDAFRERARVYEDKGDYEQAIQDYTKAFNLDAGNVSLLYDRAFACERAGKYEQAIADFSELIRRFPQSVDAYRNRGQARLYSGHPVESQQDLKRAVELDPSGYYNVIWLYIAQSRHNGAAEEELIKNSAQLNLTRWPGPVIQMFLGKISPEQSMQAAFDKDPKKYGDQQCEANFYIAEYQAIHRQREAALRGFRLARDICNKNYFFYVPAARAELASK
jgi:lipoprotein NlpI